MKILLPDDKCEIKQIHYGKLASVQIARHPEK